MKVKMIMESIMKILEEQNNLQFRTNLQSWSGVWDHQFKYVFIEETQEPSFSWASQILQNFEEMLLFQTGYMFQFFNKSGM